MLAPHRTFQNLPRLLPMLALALLVAFVVSPSRIVAAEKDEPAPVRVKTLSDLKGFIFSKMEYDENYFNNVLRLNKEGKSLRKLTPRQFKKEVKRAKANLPVLQKFSKQKERYESGKPFTMPGKEKKYRVYLNLIAMLNLIQSYEKKDYASAVAYGDRVVIDDRENLGQVKGSKDSYYLNLYREFFYTMAASHYRLGHDGKAVDWFARIEADTDLQKLKEKIEQEGEQKTDSREDRLEAVRTLPLAVMPFKNLEKNPETDWLSGGFSEVLTADLIQYTDLYIVERSQLAKVLGEVSLSQAGVTEEKQAMEVGKMLQAGAMLMGSYKMEKEKGMVTMRLVDSNDAKILGSVTGTVSTKDLFKDAREVMLKLFENIDWTDTSFDEDMTVAHSPKTETVRNLMKARLLMGTKSSEAKALFAKAIREDPKYANLFEDLKTEFKDVSATLAVIPFVNVTGNNEDVWMVVGISEALASDLPKMNFNVVERSKIEELLKEREVGQVLDNETALQMGQQISADFLVMGSMIHQEPKIRVDLRFVEVRTGMIIFTLSVEDKNDDFMALLTTMTTEIARRFNEKLSEEKVDDLVSRKTSKEEFEAYIRQQLAKETLANVVTPVEVEERPSRAPFWVAVAGAGVGTALGATGLVLGDLYGDKAADNNARADVALRDEDRKKYISERDKYEDSALAWNVVGYVGIGLAIGSVAYIIYDEVANRPGVEKDIHVKEAARVTPLVNVAREGTFVGVGGRF